MTAGELLRDARRRHGLTQRQLAIRARTSQAAISRIERGVVSPSVGTLAELLWMMNEELILQALPLDWGFDTDVLKSNLALSPDERIRGGVERSRGTSEVNGAERTTELTHRLPIRGVPVAECRTNDLVLALSPDEKKP